MIQSYISYGKVCKWKKISKAICIMTAITHTQLQSLFSHNEISDIYHFINFLYFYFYNWKMKIFLNNKT
jgi:hypothetical protein